MRFEYKYLVHLSKINSLRRRLLPYLEIDKYAEQDDSNEYTVRSIYFDTSKLKFYHEKIDGILIRKKLRVRGYNESELENVVFLEIKRKHDSHSGKNRSAVNFHDLNSLLRTGNVEQYLLTGNGYENKQIDGRKFLHHIFKNSLKPIVLIVYEREAYYSKFNSLLRITLDKNLRYLEFPSINKLYSDSELEYTLQNYCIMEIKFTRGFPGWLQSIIREFKMERRALSKYTICLDSQKILGLINKKTSLPFVESYDLENLQYLEDNL